MKYRNSCITLTFGDQAENHVGMQKIGNVVNVGDGFQKKDLEEIKDKMEKTYGMKCDLYNLGNECADYEKDDAYVLVLRNAIDKLLGNIMNIEDDRTDYAYEMFEEQSELDVDKEAFMYGRVVKKHARWNLCFDNNNQEPNYEIGKGRIISFRDIPLMNSLYENFGKFFGVKAENLKGEGNYYYDINKCGIGYHGDSERRIVIAVRLGASIPLYYQWHKNGEKIGNKIKIELYSGDMYIMSEKAVGTDWKKKKIYTLRHAAGSNKFTD